MDPKATRPVIPAEYGVPTDTADLLPWSHVTERMTAAKHYWLATVAPARTPHSRPIAGMWVEGRLYFGGSADTQWRRNLASNPSASITLEDAEKAVILEGEVRILRPDAALAARLAQASNSKYDQNQKPEDYEGADVGEFTPRVAFAWNVLYKDATRWRF